MAEIVVKSPLMGHFTMITNEFARDPEVTPRAARVFIYLMSNTDGWVTSAARVAKVLGMGESTVKAALRDLEGLGYLRRERKNVEGGRFRWDYELYPRPITTGSKTTDGATSENSENAQVGATVSKTTSGEATGGNVTPLRRPTTKKTNPQENQKKKGVKASRKVLPRAREEEPKDFLTQEKEKTTPPGAAATPPAPPRGRSRHNCTVCDHLGYRPEFNRRTGRETMIRCDHTTADAEAVEVCHREMEREGS